MRVVADLVCDESCAEVGSIEYVVLHVGLTEAQQHLSDVQPRGKDGGI